MVVTLSSLIVRSVSDLSSLSVLGASESWISISFPAALLLRPSIPASSGLNERFSGPGSPALIWLISKLVAVLNYGNSGSDPDFK